MTWPPALSTPLSGALTPSLSAVSPSPFLLPLPPPVSAASLLLPFYFIPPSSLPAVTSRPSFFSSTLILHLPTHLPSSLSLFPSAPSSFFCFLLLYLPISSPYLLYNLFTPPAPFDRFSHLHTLPSFSPSNFPTSFLLLTFYFHLQNSVYWRFP